MGWQYGGVLQSSKVGKQLFSKRAWGGWHAGFIGDASPQPTEAGHTAARQALDGILVGD